MPSFFKKAAFLEAFYKKRHQKLVFNGKSIQLQAREDSVLQIAPDFWLTQHVIDFHRIIQRRIRLEMQVGHTP